jgi:RNA polymerase sigma factor (sigma-70 family)
MRSSRFEDDAEDATQEVLLKIATRLESFRGDSSFRTWAYRIMANHVLDRQRSRPEQVVHDCAGISPIRRSGPAATSLLWLIEPHSAYGETHGTT